MTSVYMRQTAKSVLRKLQRGFGAIETWCEHWNIKINEDKTQAMYFFDRLRPPQAHITLKGWNIHCISHIKYLGLIFDKITMRLHTRITMIEGFRTFIRINSLFKSEHLSTNIKLIFRKALMRSVVTYACPT
jgi:hypothetical protein